MLARRLSKSERHKVTLIDVAKHAGVSRATASLVLRNSPLVADETRKTVLASMQTLGYVYNRAAANLRSHQSRTIGLIVTDITNPFFAELSVAIENQLSDANYAVLMSSTMDDPEKQQHLLEIMNGYQVDGVLLCPALDTPSALIDLLQTWRLPFVLVARKIEHHAADYAGADNVTGAEIAIQHLCTRGHKRIAFLGGPSPSSPREERLQGYKNSLARNHLEFDPAIDITSDVSRQGGITAMLKALDLPDPPTAALCYNDVVAFGAMLALQSRNMVPGKDFAVVGFDDVADAAFVRPALTTVSIPPAEIGKTAIDLLLKRIENPIGSPVINFLSPELIIRDSS